MKYRDLPIGAHYRLESVVKAGIVLPSVRIKVSETHYRMLHPSHGIKRPAATGADVIPVSDIEQRTGVRS